MDKLFWHQVFEECGVFECYLDLKLVFNVWDFNCDQRFTNEDRFWQREIILVVPLKLYIFSKDVLSFKVHCGCFPVQALFQYPSHLVCCNYPRQRRWIFFFFFLKMFIQYLYSRMDVSQNIVFFVFHLINVLQRVVALQLNCSCLTNSQNALSSSSRE